MNTLRFKACQQLDLQQTDGDTAITGWEQADIELVVDGDLGECQAEQQENLLVIRSHSALALRVPQDITLDVGQASEELILHNLEGLVSVDTVCGDLSIGSCSAEIAVQKVQGSLVAEHLTGALDIGTTSGDIHMHNVSAVHLGQTDGAVYARVIDGALDMGIVQGDIQARQVTGLLTLEKGHGAFRGHDLRGGMDLQQIGGDLVLRTSIAPAHTWRAQADGSITTWFPAETSARFVLQAQGRISAKLPDIENHEPGCMVGQAGAGEAEITLEAGGDIFVQVQGHQTGEFDAWAAMDSISGQIEAEIAQHMGGMNVDATAQREIDRAMRKAEQELAKAQQRFERETLRAQESAQRVQERAARAARRAQAKIARKSPRWGGTGDIGLSLFGPTPAPRSPRAIDAGPSSEEQFAILEMLQQNKITVAEAEALLAALGG